MLVPALTLPVRGATALVATIPVPASPSGGQKTAPGCSFLRGIEEGRTLGREGAGGLTGDEHLGQQVAQRRELPVREPVVAPEEVGVVVPRGGIDREHPGRVTDPEHPATREFLVHVTGKGGEMRDLGHVRFGVTNRLVQVCDRPPQRDVDPEQPGQLGRRVARRRVAPGAERNEQLAVGVEREIAVHHRRDADRGEGGGLDVVAVPHIGDEVGVGRLQSGPDILERVRPDAVDELVLPLVGTARDDDRRVVADQAGLDAGRAELDAEGRPAGGDRVDVGCGRGRRHRRTSPLCP